MENNLEMEIPDSEFINPSMEKLFVIYKDVTSHGGDAKLIRETRAVKALPPSLSVRILAD